MDTSIASLASVKEPRVERDTNGGSHGSQLWRDTERTTFVRHMWCIARAGMSARAGTITDGTGPSNGTLDWSRIDQVSSISNRSVSLEVMLTEGMQRLGPQARSQPSGVDL